MDKEIPVVEKIETELLNIPIKHHGDFAWFLADGDALLRRLVQLAERQFNATGPGILGMTIHTESLGDLYEGSVLDPCHGREKIIKDLRKKFDSLIIFCYGFWSGASEGPGWDALQPQLRVTWQTKANSDAVRAAETKGAFAAFGSFVS